MVKYVRKVRRNIKKLIGEYDIRKPESENTEKKTIRMSM